MRVATFVLLLALTTSGCAAIRASQAKEAHVREATQSYTYQKPCVQVWQAARTMLFAQDYQVKSADAAAGLTLETDWKDESKGLFTRYLFQGVAPTDTSCQVMATRATKNMKGETNMERDWHMEWNLIKQVDADGARQIEADASQAGEAARNQK